MPFKILFLTIISEINLLNLHFFFTLLLFLIWLDNSFQKYIVLLAGKKKKSNWLVDLGFEIYLDIEF